MNQIIRNGQTKNAYWILLSAFFAAGVVAIGLAEGLILLGAAITLVAAVVGLTAITPISDHRVWITESAARLLAMGTNACLLDRPPPVDSHQPVSSGIWNASPFEPPLENAR